MARSDLLLSLVRAGSSGDRALFERSVEALIAEERAAQHHVLAERLTESLKTNANGHTNGSAWKVDERIQRLFFEVSPRRQLDELILPPAVEQAIGELVEEHLRGDLLRSHGLEPRHRVLLVGPPGNGKTSLAEALASGLLVPFVVVRYEGAIGSYLGETANRLDQLFAVARTRKCVLFFDEFDVLAKERGDVHETGEIKRVVSSLLLQVDALPSYVVVVVATNHPELLDRAVWRRFQLRLDLPRPGTRELEHWFERFVTKLGMPVGSSAAALAREVEGASFAEAEELGASIQRRLVLDGPDADVRKIVRGRIEQWRRQYRLPSAGGV